MIEKTPRITLKKRVEEFFWNINPDRPGRFISRSQALRYEEKTEREIVARFKRLGIKEY